MVGKQDQNKDERRERTGTGKKSLYCSPEQWKGHYLSDINFK